MAIRAFLKRWIVASIRRSVVKVLHRVKLEFSEVADTVTVQAPAQQINPTSC
jgi:hypothetical protein